MKKYIFWIVLTALIVVPFANSGERGNDYNDKSGRTSVSLDDNDGGGGHSNVAPGTCATCHNGSVAEGKDRGHISTSASCDTCHRTSGWEPAIGSTEGGHSNVAPGTCATCHNGTSARGKNSRHIATTASCDTCHRTSGWEPATAGHSNVAPGTCATCHNGTSAQGKNLSHISTTASCDTCHQTTGWKPATGGHSNVTPGTCATCHNGTSAQGKNSTHISTTASCDTCHQTTGWKPATVNHSNVAKGTCATCHNGTSASGKNSTHISTTTSCDTCHLTTAWKPATMSHANMAPGTCATCHNGTSASGKSSTHIATTTSCDTCHLTTAWKPATMSHANMAPGTCATCHNGTSASGKNSTHISTTTSCDTCHLSTAWKPATMSHSNVAPGTCATCHNGTSASGKSSTHIATTISCDTCHQTTAWKPATMNHSNVAKGTCATCHNGASARGKSPMHTSTTASCDTCHLKTAWIPTTISTLNFPVEAVFTSLVSTASTYTASTSDTAGNNFLLSVNRSPAPDKTNALIYPAPLKTYTQTNILKKNGTVISTDNYEVFYSVAPFGLYGSLNDLYGASNYMKVTTQFSLPATDRIGSSGVLYKGRNYINNATLSPDTWYAVWSLEADSPTTAWLCLSIEIAPANATTTSTAEMECFQIDSLGNVTGFKADTIESGVNLGLSGGVDVSSRGDVVVEFYNANLDHYFITADMSEVAAIDNGNAGPGWMRTGNSFKSGGSTSVCRFYGSQSPGPNSHFYTGDPGECGYLKQLQASTPDTERRWNFESLVFVTTPPTNGTCPTGTTPVYRAYNNGFTRGIDSNHRITSSLTAIQEVVSLGWSDEGIVMCAPN